MHLPEGWHLSRRRIPVPPSLAPTGRTRRRSCASSFLPPDLLHDPTYALNSPLWDRWFEVEHDSQPVRIKALLSEVVDGSGQPGELIGQDLTIACGTGAVRLIRAQRAGKAQQSGTELLNGFKIETGSLFSSAQRA